ncbi:N-acetylmuramic acid 6-phosphate etherase [Geobacillus sp. Y412MC52]|uniref:N-acetylmuramic acid 6-phosphate etherase n=1 Tax=Geobacillus sp. (strain Y412MC52) TaxID=550542 RepID=UPI00018C1BA6|nr:N-acetylmuramic acid 6-phosphate etherase [Geobacillus sp. Y412MC52]ADU94362.1 glucokinase regulatory-like protein [Geobacillus sp. Y412MC52]
MFERLTTEQGNEKTRHLDEMTTKEILQAMNEEDQTVAAAVARQLDSIEKLVHIVIAAFQRGGKLIYVGAGTSGRLGLLDAVECPPTFGVDPKMVQAVIAGGREAVANAVEGAEDDEEAAVRDLEAVGLTANDVVVGIAASGRTPYVVSALRYAKKRGAATGSIACNHGAEISQYADAAVEIETGPEVLAGSTRLKAGTAQKMVLNMISTASMVGIGKVYGNWMVDVQATNEKLKERAKRILMEATGVNAEEASRYYEQANGEVKTAIVMILRQCSYEEAKARLQKTGGFVRKALD